MAARIRKAPQLTVTQTSSYRPSAVGTPSWLGFGLNGRIFDLSAVDIMMLDATVALGVAMLESPLSTADGQWDITASSEEVARFVDRTLHRFWLTSLPIALQAIRYGYSGAEALYKYDEQTGLIYFNRLRPIHPKDVRVLTMGGEYAGLRVVSGGPSSSLLTDKEKITLNGPRPGVPAKGVWFYHGTHYNTYYGKSRLLSAWLPWRDKCSQDGALDIVRMWYYRLAFTGPRVRHPERDQRQPDGTVIPARDMARQIAEWIKVGAGISLPDTWNPKTKQFAWQIEDPKINGNAEGLLDYVKWLDGQITRGLLIPDNVVTEASSTGGGGGGGYSSRKVPEDAFYVLEERLLHDTITPFDDQAIRGLVRMNFGPKAHYEIKMRPLTPARQQAAAELAQQSQAGSPDGGSVPAPAGPDDADNAETEAMRNQGGTSGGRDNQQNLLSLDVIEANMASCKDRNTFQYREPDRDGCGYGQCSSCSHFTGMMSCNIHGPEVLVYPGDSCRYYLRKAIMLPVIPGSRKKTWSLPKSLACRTSLLAGLDLLVPQPRRIALRGYLPR